MHEPTSFRFHVRLGFLGWVLVLATVVVTTAVAIFALGILLLLIPVMIVAALLQYFFWRWRFRRVATKRMTDSAIIDGEYRVVEPQDGVRKPPGGRLS